MKTIIKQKVYYYKPELRLIYTNGTHEEYSIILKEMNNMYSQEDYYERTILETDTKLDIKIGEKVYFEELDKSYKIKHKAISKDGLSVWYVEDTRDFHKLEDYEQNILDEINSKYEGLQNNFDLLKKENHRLKNRNLIERVLNI